VYEQPSFMRQIVADLVLLSRIPGDRACMRRQRSQSFRAVTEAPVSAVRRVDMQCMNVARALLSDAVA